MSNISHSYDTKELLKTQPCREMWSLPPKKSQTSTDSVTDTEPVKDKVSLWVSTCTYPCSEHQNINLCQLYCNETGRKINRYLFTRWKDGYIHTYLNICINGPLSIKPRRIPYLPKRHLEVTSKIESRK